MIEDLKPYRSIKDSCVPWLGKVPTHWGVRRGKWLFRHKKQLNTNGANTNVLSLTLRGVVNNDPDNPEGLVPKDYATYQLFRKGDLVFKLIDLENLRTSRVGLVPEDGIMSSAYVRLTPQSALDIRFFYQQYFDLYQRGIYNQLGAGVRSTLGPNDLLDLQILVPPLAEQSAIVRFLNHADRRIRRYIHTKQKLIKLLEEQKQAIIHRAVTRGLDHTAALKPSGIPWLGDIPQHWNWIPIKRLLSRMDYGTSEASTEAGSIRILTMGNIQKSEVVMPRSGGLDHVPDALLLDHHDLLFTRTNGNPDLVGKVGIFRGQASDRVSFASYLVRLRVKRAYEAQWLHMLLNSSAFWPFARSHALVNLQTNLNSTRYGQFLVPVPPRAEQVQIVARVKDESKTLNTTISRLEREIELLREYRIRLIADVVTGKLDVREAAANLPDEPEISDGAETPGGDDVIDDIDAASEETEA